MSNILKHKGYSARIEFDATDRVLFGRIAGIEDGIGFHGETVEQLVAAFEEAVEDYVETCKKVGKTPEKPYSGKLMLRVDPSVHAAAAVAAKLLGKSLNQFGEDAIRRAAHQTTRA